MNPYYSGYGNYGMNPNFNPNFANNRLNALEQQFNHQQQPQPIQQVQQPQFPSIRPVTSIEEVRGITPNFDGSKLWFEDTTNKKLYTKYIDMNGLPHIDTYTLSIEEEKPTEGYCTKEEYNALKSDLDNYKNVLDSLLNQLGGNKNE